MQINSRGKRQASAADIIRFIDDWALDVQDKIKAEALASSYWHDNIPMDVKNLWAFLTGLRGPDSDDYGEKQTTTAIVRYPIKHLARLVNATVVAPKSFSYHNLRIYQGATNLLKATDAHHFSSHIRAAACAIVDMGLTPKQKDVTYYGDGITSSTVDFVPDKDQ